jgi:hypothetical protein
MRHLGWRAIAATTFVLAAAPLYAAVAISPTMVPLSGHENSRQLVPAAAVRTGNAVLLWEDKVSGIVGRIIDVNGNPGPEFVVAASQTPPSIPFNNTLKIQRAPAIDVKPDGSFLVAWTEETQYCSIDIFSSNCSPQTSHVMARAYTSAATPAGVAFEVAKPTVTTGEAGNAAVLYTSAGYWIAWDDVGGTASAVRVRRLDSRNRLGAVSTVAAAGRLPVIALGGDLLMIGWQSPANATPTQVAARLYQASRGRAVGPVVALESVGGRAVGHLAVAGRPGGTFLTAWEWTSPAITVPRIAGQVVSRTGARSGAELTLVGNSTAGGGAPELVTTGDGWLALWTKKLGPTTNTGKELGSFTTAGAASGTPQDLNTTDANPNIALDDGALAIGKDGRVLAAWVGYDASALVTIRARLALAAAPPTH